MAFVLCQCVEMCIRGGGEEKINKEITCMERVHHCKNILHGLHASSFVGGGGGGGGDII